MSISPRKSVEFAVHMVLDKSMILQQTELEQVDHYNYFDNDSSCHTYFICKRPRISFDPAKVFVTKESIFLVLKIQKQDKFEEHNYVMRNDFGTTDIQIECNYPFSLLTFKTLGKKITTIKAAALLHLVGNHDENDTYIDLEILYIGQSYGKEGSRTAPDRLKSHSTLQTIYASSIQKHPDSEIWILLASFEQIIITSFNGIDEEETNEQLNMDLEVSTFHQLHSTGLSTEQTINVTEAALIRYFQPEFNTIYKDSFPSITHSIYSECYDLDINSISMELNTMEYLNCQIYSNKTPRKFNHMFHYTMHTSEEKKSMFEFFPGMDVPGLQNPIN